MAATSVSRSLVASVVLLFWSTFNYVEAGMDQFVPQDPELCECVNAELTFNCTMIGSGTTVWRGTSFNCPERANEITLLHSNFLGSSEICGGIVGSALTVDNNNCYTSQLTVTIQAELNNKTISCRHNGPDIIGSTLLTVISGSGELPPPMIITLSDIQQGMLSFTWDSVLPNCTRVRYNITTIGCGTCEVSTGASAICSNPPLSTVASVCNFSVYSEACGFSGTLSNPFTVILKAPGVPQTEITPVYASNGTLTRIVAKIQQETAFNFTHKLSGSVVKYSFKLFYLTEQSSVVTKEFSTCDDAVCVYNVTSQSLCSRFQLSNFNISVSAANAVSQGDESQPFSIDCSNQLVQVVEYNIRGSIPTITCVFLDSASQSESVNYTCSIRYGPCGKEANQVDSTVNSSNRVTLRLATGLSGCYMYTVTASNTTHVAMVEGSFDIATVGESNAPVIVVPIVVVVIVVIIVVLTAVSIIAYYWRKMSTPRDHEADSECAIDHDNIIDGTDQRPLNQLAADIDSDTERTLEEHNVIPNA